MQHLLFICEVPVHLYGSGTSSALAGELALGGYAELNPIDFV
ncbi:hypothetical protein THTE_3934 [Thermogutta terrifontis]|uniref:Uncharacterized protein n=1 Tax=Thermogutta terrifontis TaxID=1331910 RepID=A0A286RKP0_9BACT|nr:hypothetical protein THTE_3934 [Thermogutta terrifontis]